MIQRGRPQNVVFDKVSGKGMTINQFVKQGAKEMRRLCLTRSEVIKRKLLTKNALEMAIKTGDLKEIIHGNKHYVYRAELNTLFAPKNPLPYRLKT